MSLNCTAEKETLGYRIVYASSLGIIFVVAILLNVKTFLIILKQKRESRTAITIFLLNMTLVSGLMALLLIPFNIHAIIERKWIFGEVFCQINGFANMFLCMVLVLTLFCITIDRYFSVVKPLRHRLLMTRRIAYRMLVAAYFLAFLSAIMPIADDTKYEYHPGTNHCSPPWHKSCAYYFIMMFLGFLTPILGMLITYTKIILTLRENRRTMVNWGSSARSTNISKKNVRVGVAEDTRDGSPTVSQHVSYSASNTTTESDPQTNGTDQGLSSTSQIGQRRSGISSVILRMRNQTRIPQEYRIARTGFILVLTFAVLWAPYLVAHSCFAGICRATKLLNVAMLLVYFNAVANPIIYALTNRTVIRNFRSHFRRLCQRS